MIVTSLNREWVIYRNNIGNLLGIDIKNNHKLPYTFEYHNGYIPLLKLFTNLHNGSNSIFGTHHNCALESRYKYLVNIDRHPHIFKYCVLRRIIRNIYDSENTKVIFTGAFSALGTNDEEVNNISGNNYYSYDNFPHRLKNKFTFEGMFDVFMLGLIKQENIASNVHYIRTTHSQRTDFAINPAALKILVNKDTLKDRNFMKHYYTSTLRAHLLTSLKERAQNRGIEVEEVSNDEIFKYLVHKRITKEKSLMKLIELEKNIKDKVFDELVETLTESKFATEACTYQY
jgi:hypothetical protein